MTPHKSTPVKPKARQIIISQMIDSARAEVIKNDIELNFLLRLKEKFEKGDMIITKSHNVPQLSDNIDDAKDHFKLSLERLIYLKELREHSKSDRAAASVENCTPATITVELL